MAKPMAETRPSVADLAREPFDLIVVGAGINGAGIARDAALRGLRTLLLDKGDVGGGTTSWSTRLVHGGLRYLEHREVGLVRESLRERERLLRLAPHLVKPLPLVIPIYRGGTRGPWLIRLGMVAYDALSFDKSLARHRMLGRDEALRRVPGLDPTDLRGAAVYYDAQVTFAERLAVENALDARDHGATLLTHALVDRLLVEEGAVRGVAVTDLLDGGGSGEVRAPAVVNVAGPWVDRVLAGDAGAPTPRRMIGGTKGSHVVVRPFPGAPEDALYVEARQDGRPFFVVPWNGQFLIGTTDTRYEGDLDKVEPTEEEIAYLIGETNRVLPNADLGREDVNYAYAGIRPLPHVANGREGAITRRHLVHDHGAGGGPSGLFSIVGGKLTTYRELAEQAVTAVGGALGRFLPPVATARAPLPGAAFPAGEDAETFGVRLAADGELPAATVAHLVAVYGARATDVLALAAADPTLREPFDPVSGAIGAEVVFAFEQEAARTLGDALLRRTMVGLGPEAGIGADEAAADVARRHLGWDTGRVEREVTAYRAYVERFRPRALERRLVQR
jgi:glycerol-3-phosphate dehydrogenase